MFVKKDFSKILKINVKPVEFLDAQSVTQQLIVMSVILKHTGLMINKEIVFVKPNIL